MPRPRRKGRPRHWSHRIDGDTVAEIRERRRLTQAELGAAAAITRSYVSEIEGGRRKGTIKVAIAIAAALGVGVPDITMVDADQLPAAS